MHHVLASIHVRLEALTILSGGERPSPLSLSQQGGEAGGSLSRGAPGRAGAAPTKPGRVSTARWRGSGEIDEEEYARNQRHYVSQRLTGSNLADGGRERCAPGPSSRGGELRGGLMARSASV